MGALIKIAGQEIDEKGLLPLLAQYKMLPQLTKEIIIDRAIANIECAPKEEEMIWQRFYKRNQITSEEQLKLWLEYYGMTPEQQKCCLLREYKLEKFKQATWGSRLESYFLQQKRQLDRVVYSLIRSKDPGIAQELYFRIQEGETSFTELAKQYSEGAEAETGGLVGPIELSLVTEKLARLLSTSQPGQLHQPTRIEGWWIILRLEKYLSTQLDEAMRQRLLNDLFQEWLNAQLQQK